MGTGDFAHVLDAAQGLYTHPLQELEQLPGVEVRDRLRGHHHDRTGDRDEFEGDLLNVTGARREVVSR